MIYNKFSFGSGVTVAASSFLPQDGAVEEHNLIFSTKDCHENVEGKIKHILSAFESIKRDVLSGKVLTPVFCRWFLSDVVNQSGHINPREFGCASSIIGQPPSDGSKIALWLYCQTDVEVREAGENFYRVARGRYTDFWQGDRSAGENKNSEISAIEHLKDYAGLLAKHGAGLKDNCIRTWFFVRDVDINYPGVVRGRNIVFADEGLDSAGHFIASTGIAGDNVSPRETVTFNAYAVDGINWDQVTYLKASTHFNPAMEYGVAFERATAVDYADRRQLFVSGTASIDNKGRIMYPGDVTGQTRRVGENVEALLKEWEAAWEDVSHMIIYLRDFSDHDVVEKLFEQRFPEIPKVMVQAPVCRPGWLVEMECMACSRRKAMH